MDRLNKLEIFYHDRPVGTMALYQNRLAAFEYNGDWLAEGFSVSPFSLPLEKKVFMPKINPFEGLFGVFADSLPDGWVISPSYDLTYSNSIGGEHATTVNGNGVNPGMEDILAVAKKIGLNTNKARKTATDIKECVFDSLREYI